MIRAVGNVLSKKFRPSFFSSYAKALPPYINNQDKEKLLKFGYTEEQIANFSENSLKFFNKYVFTQEEKALFTEQGYSEKIINRMNDYFFRIASMNEASMDGMRPMTRKEMIELVVRDYKPDITNINKP